MPSSLVNVRSSANATIQLAVEVSEGAKLYVNEKLTKSTGPTRQFLSSNLERGKKYQFSVRAEAMGLDGKMISETQQVSMAAGESNTMKFALLDHKTKLVATTPRSSDYSAALSP
jgi:uncharacterized protein (TIGR03000 family)